MNYEKDIAIDESSLDIEWLEQPNLMMRYSKLAAECRKDTDIAKENVDVTYAELDAKIRSNPDKFGINGKITEKVIENVVKTHSRYRKAVEEYNNARFEQDMARAAVNSIEHRKSALENLVRLHGQQWFAGPSVPRDLSKEWENKQKQNKSDNAVSAAMSRKRK